MRSESDDWLDLICDEFEDACQRGELPLLDNFLARTEPTNRPKLFLELLYLEIEYRLAKGYPASSDEYLGRFPQFATQIETVRFSQPRTLASSGDRMTPESVTPQTVRVSRFELLEKVGSGASGDVWKAFDPRLQRAVAIKLARADGVGAGSIQGLLREARAAAQLRHPGIVAVHEVGREGNLAYIVSDFIDGSDLRRILAVSRYDCRDAAALAATIAAALHAAHEQGIVHRDLKPANILIDKTAQPHIADFGLAKWISDAQSRTLHGQIIGTPAYMSPEQARGRPASVDRRSDIFALAVILYELLTGNVPFHGNHSQVLAAIIGDDALRARKLNPLIPRDLDTICQKGMEKEPSRRYATAQKMAVDLRRFLQGEPPLARRTGRVESAWRWLRRRPATATSLVLSLSVVVAAGAIVSLRQQNYEIQGYRLVDIDTNPSGARLAIVPADQRTGEPTSDGRAIIFPRKLTPLQIQLKPGTYLMEAVVPNGKEPLDFAEVYRTIAPLDMLPAKRVSRNDGTDQDSTMQIRIRVHSFSDVVANMVRIPIDGELRRKDPLLPEVMYIDSKETRPDDLPATNIDPALTGEQDLNRDYFLFADAQRLAEVSGKRLLSAIEYDAILSSTQPRMRGRLDDDRPADLDGGLPEWTTTKFDYTGVGTSSQTMRLRSMHVLRGHDDPGRFPGILRSVDGQLISSPEAESSLIGFRGARSGAPRFFKP